MLDVAIAVQGECRSETLSRYAEPQPAIALTLTSVQRYEKIRRYASKYAKYFGIILNNVE